MSGWVVVYKCTNANHAAMMKAFLEDNEIPAIVINKMDSMHMHLMNGEIELHVKNDDAIQAKRLIDKQNN